MAQLDQGDNTDYEHGTSPYDVHDRFLLEKVSSQNDFTASSGYGDQAWMPWLNPVQWTDWQAPWQAPAPFRYGPLPMHDSFYFGNPNANLQSPAEGAYLNAAPMLTDRSSLLMTQRSTTSGFTERRAPIEVPVQAATPVPVETTGRTFTFRQGARPDGMSPSSLFAEPVVESSIMQVAREPVVEPSIMHVQDDSMISLGSHGQPWAAVFTPEEWQRTQRAAVGTHLEPSQAEVPVAMVVMQADRDGDVWRLSEGYSH
jgi:hypothetical protein